MGVSCVAVSVVAGSACGLVVYWALSGIVVAGALYSVMYSFRRLE